MHFAFAYSVAFLLLALLVCFVRCKREPLKIYFAKTSFLPSSLLQKEYLPLLISALFVFFLAGPFTYSSFAESAKKGRDLVVAIDASGSMEGEFGKESKFATLMKLLRHFLHKRFDDNVGIVVFGSFAYPASGITYDIRALDFILDYLEVGLAGNNTAIGDALMQAVQLLKKNNAKEKVILLFSDGHHNSGTYSPKEGVEAAKKIGARIYTVGIGNEYDKKLLETIAKSSGGKSFAAKSPEDLAAVFKEIDALESSPLRSGIYVNQRYLFFSFGVMLVALLLWQIKRYL